VLATSAAAATSINLTDAQLLDRGSAVQVTASVACDPLGPDSQAFFSVDLWQGKYPHSNFIEGFGSYGELGGFSLTCDGTARTYSVTVTPNQFFTDKRFRTGPATTEYQIIVCTLVAPETYQCDSATGLIRESIRVHR
jgi:hypothetical protein